MYLLKGHFAGHSLHDLLPALQMGHFRADNCKKS